MTKRILTLVVALALTVGLLPMAASADGGAFGSAPHEEPYDFSGRPVPEDPDLQCAV